MFLSSVSSRMSMMPRVIRWISTTYSCVILVNQTIVWLAIPLERDTLPHLFSPQSTLHSVFTLLIIRDIPIVVCLIIRWSSTAFILCSMWWSALVRVVRRISCIRLSSLVSTKCISIVLKQMWSWVILPVQWLTWTQSVSVLSWVEAIQVLSLLLPQQRLWWIKNVS